MDNPFQMLYTGPFDNEGEMMRVAAWLWEVEDIIEQALIEDGYIEA